jgi:hypothetical protein
MHRRSVASVLAIASLLCAACGGTPRAATADLVAVRQPTPDPTLDAVVRDLPRTLAGIVPTATPTPQPAPPVVAVPKPKVAPATPKVVPATPTVAQKAPTPRPPTPTVAKPRR